MIPRIIHYCWFGKKEMPALALNCIRSWNDHLPDYQLRLWDEQSFDININTYVQEAYRARKYAFVTDYVRLYVLYNIGGIYMDTDVEVVKSFDDLMHLPGFSGFESEKDVPTGVIACEPHNIWAKEMLDWYAGKHFLRLDGKSDFTSNVEIISGIMASRGFILENSYQVYKNCMHIFPKDYFCPKTRTGIVKITSNTYCIHHFAASWIPWHRKIKRIIFRDILGSAITDKLVSLKRKFLVKLNHTQK